MAESAVHEKTVGERNAVNGGDTKPVDPWCDHNNPRIVHFESISAAAYRIKDGIVRTACDKSHISEGTGMEIYFKKDFNQYTGSFKERGARFTLMMLPEAQKKKGVISASAGNHALAMAYHGTLLNVPVTVVMPVSAPIMKVQNCRRFGAHVVIFGNNLAESIEKAFCIAKKKGLMYINGFDHPNIIAGQGTMGLEILEQVPDMDAAIIPVGGGGLIAGVAVALKTMKPTVTIIGVESERAPGFSAAVKAGKPVYVPTQPSLADGLGVSLVGCNSLATAAPFIDRMVTVPEEAIASAILRLIEKEKAVVEGGAAVGVAAILEGLVPELKGKRVVVPLCGGNIDSTVLGRCIDRGLAADGRLLKFTVTVSDRPGGVAELTKSLCDIGVSVKDIIHERAWLKSDIFSVQVSIVVETRDARHACELKKMLQCKYEKITFTGAAEALGMELLSPPGSDDEGSDREDDDGDDLSKAPTERGNLVLPTINVPRRSSIFTVNQEELSFLSKAADK